MSDAVPDLLDRARAWLDDDPDAETRAELERVVADVEAGGDPADLADRFDGTLEFGTAGPARRARRRAQPDEPGRRAARGGRARGVPHDAGRPPGQPAS